MLPDFYPFFTFFMTNLLKLGYVSTHKCDMTHCVTDEQYKIQVTLYYFEEMGWGENFSSPNGSGKA